MARPRLFAALFAALTCAVGLAGCGGAGSPGPTGGVSVAPTGPGSAGRPAVPTPDHVVIVVLENKDVDQIIGGSDAPYLTGLAGDGANFTDAHAETHPSQPNYLALFSGDTHGVHDDNCVDSLSGPNLGSALLGAGKTFTGYSEDLPGVGYIGCQDGGYARKHNPWVNFDNLPAEVNRPLSDLPSDYSALPTVAFVIPNLCHDMHDCDVAAGDDWMKQNLDGYVRWAQTHNSLLVVTFDESESTKGDNQIATVFAGPMVKAGEYSEGIDHYRILRTIEDMYGLDHAGKSAQADPITDVWTTGS
ncbi:alkaline phosphatase family protein [Pseudonocardia acidicola]|uniref:alkaline phosphatase family protein n=1 Tax=Pseudonocardia acidicola TaxID=2724939 RepID=UPI00308413B4